MKSPRAMSREELEEEVAYWRGEVSLIYSDDSVGRMIQAGVPGRMPALMALSLYSAAPKPVSKWMLLHQLRSNGSRATDLKVIDVYVHRLRRLIGQDSIETIWAQGVLLTPKGEAFVESIGLPRRPISVAA